MKLKKKQKKAIDEYIRWVADEMELRDWTLRVDMNVDAEDLRNIDDHDGDDQVWGASCDPVRGRKYAIISLGREVIGGLLDGDREGFRQTVAHELTHCHFAMLWELMRIDLMKSDLVSQSFYDLFILSAERNMEYGVDAVAEAISKHLPLINLPE